MAGKGTISITFKLDGDGKGFKNLANDANGLKKALSSTLVEAQKFNTKAINFAAISVGISQASSSINQLMDSLSSLTGGYQNAKQAQTQLITVMKQRMDASDADIESVNNLISAQTELGVIGGTVQKRGAQQVATFLTQKSSLMALIPAMNNLIAQQKGINATEEDAYSVANMMGKAMQGQTSAMRRVGMTFTSSQEQVMKYGNESQRAAMLSQIITQNVGNMNAELGKTDIGKQKQLENKLAAIKNQIGGVAQAAMPYLSAAANVTMLAANAANAAGAIRLLGAAFISFTVKSKLAAAAMYIYRSASIAVTAATRVLQAAFTGGAVGATTMKVAIRGLLISTGVGAAIAGLTMLIEYFVNKSNDVSDSSKKAANGIDTVAESAKRANDAYKNTQSDTYSGLMTKYKQLQAAWKGLTSEQSKIAWVKNNQSAFSDLGIRVRNVKDAEQIFSKNTTAVVNSFIRRAKAAARLAEITEEYRIQMDLADKISTRNDEANKRHHVNTGDVVKGGSHTTQGGYEEVGNDGNWHYTDKGAARANSKRWMANTAQDKADRLALRKSQERSKRLEKGMANDIKSNKPLTVSTSGTSSTRRTPRRTPKITPKVEPKLNLTNPKTLEEVDAAIEKQQNLRKKANASNIAGYDAEIKRLEVLRKSIENAGHKSVPTDQIKTYSQLNDEISYYNDRLNDGNEDVRKWAKSNINELERLKKKWDDAQEDMNKPADISQLNTMDDLDEAISYYSDLQKRQSGESAQETQKNIDALTEKKNLIQFSIEIPNEQKEIDEIESMSKKDYKIRLEAIGIDEIQKKIKDLKDLLDSKNLTDGQRKGAKKLLSGYIRLGRTVDDTNKKSEKLEGISNVAQNVDQLAQSIGTLAGESKGMAAAVSVVSLAASISQLIAGMVEKANTTTLTIWDWIAGVAAGTAAVVSTASQFKGMAFANGGVISGPTLGLMGEYPGASSNPEVVAPLDKLRGMLQSNNVAVGGEFRVKGRDLVATIANETRISNKSGRKTNIRI